MIFTLLLLCCSANILWWGSQLGVIRKTSERAVGKAWDTGHAVTQEQHTEVGATLLLQLCQSEGRLTQKGLLLLFIFC